MTSLLRAPTAQSLSVRPGRKTISASELLQQMCPFQYRREALGSRLTTIGRVVQSKTREPVNQPLFCMEELSQHLSKGGVCSPRVFYEIWVGQVVPFNAYQE